MDRRRQQQSKGNTKLQEAVGYVHERDGHGTSKIQNTELHKRMD